MKRFQLRKLRRLRKEKKNRTEYHKVKVIFFTHLLFAAMQTILALAAYGFRQKGSLEPAHFCLFSLGVCGLFAFPVWATKRIRKNIKQHEYSGPWGNWILQPSITLLLVNLFLFPAESTSLNIVTGSIVTTAFAAILLIISVRRPKRLAARIASK